MRRKWYDGHLYDYRRITPRVTDPAHGQWNRWGPFEKNLWLWSETNRFLREFGDSITEHRYLRLKSEDIFAGQDAAWSQLYSFLGVPPTPRRRVARILGQRLNAQETGVFPGASEWTPEMYEQLVALAGSESQAMAYPIA